MKYILCIHEREEARSAAFSFFRVSLSLVHNVFFLLLQSTFLQDFQHPMNVLSLPIYYRKNIIKYVSILYYLLLFLMF